MKYLKYFIPIWGAFYVVKDPNLKDYGAILLIWYHFAVLCGIILGYYKLIQLL